MKFYVNIKVNEPLLGIKSKKKTVESLMEAVGVVRDWCDDIRINAENLDAGVYYGTKKVAYISYFGEVYTPGHVKLPLYTPLPALVSAKAPNWGVVETRIREIIEEDKVETTPHYWDCECDKDYIHSKSEPYCPACFAYEEDQPDSRVVEVLNKMRVYQLTVKVWVDFNPSEEAFGQVDQLSQVFARVESENGHVISRETKLLTDIDEIVEHVGTSFDYLLEE